MNKYDEAMKKIAYRRVRDAPKVAVEDLNRLEESIGQRLPPDYKTFLLEFGLTAGRGITRSRAPDDPADEGVRVEVFYGIKPGDTYDLLDNREVFEEDLPPHLLAIASSPGGQLVISLAGEDVGSIYWWAQHTGSRDPFDDLELIARDFGSFVQSLYTTEK